MSEYNKVRVSKLVLKNEKVKWVKNIMLELIFEYFYRETIVIWTARKYKIKLLTVEYDTYFDHEKENIIVCNIMFKI